MVCTVERMTETPWFLYIVRCADGSLYTGIAKDLGARMAQHNSGRGARYTRGRGPVTLVYQEAAGSHGDALRRECAIKAFTRLQKERLIRE